MEIEHIEDRKGQDVVDCDGKRIGTLEDVYFEAGLRKAIFGCVKSHTVGQRHLLVPLTGASVSRDHVRVAYPRDQVKVGPQIEPGATLKLMTAQELAYHYQIELTPLPAAGNPRYESARARP